MKFKKGDLVQYLEQRFSPSPFPTPNRGDFGIVINATPAPGDFSNENRYRVHWQKHNESGVVYESEITQGNDNEV